MESQLNRYGEFILPHDRSDAPFNSLAEMKKCDLMIAEVSFPSTGLGIEIGWAHASGIPLLFLAKSGATVTNALGSITVVQFYQDSQEMIQLITSFLQGHKF